MKKKEIKSWLKDVRPRHKRLTDTVESLISNLLDENKIDYLSVSGRTKKLDDALDKIRRKKYSNPKDQLTDLSGIRIITYFESQVRDISEVIRQAFSVDAANSMDQDRLLGEDRIGYRSVHFVCTLGTDRENLPEYGAFAGLKFELQIRTVLQHAWAELAHDRSYKFSGELPKKLQRQLNLYSGMLEVVDQGFDEIALGVDKYKQRIGIIKLADINNIELDSINTKEIIDRTIQRHNLLIADEEVAKKIINELKNFGIIIISDLKKAMTDDFFEAQKIYRIHDSYIGFLRDLMMYSDIEKYFEKSWGNSWKLAGPAH